MCYSKETTDIKVGCGGTLMPKVKKGLYICKGYANCKANDRGACPHSKPHKWVDEEDSYFGCMSADGREPASCDCRHITKMEILINNL